MSLFSKIATKRTTPAGIECGPDGYRFVQLALGEENRVRVASFVAGDPEAGAVDALALKRVVRSIAGRRCVVSPMASDLVVRPARLPRLEPAEFREAARWDAAQMLDCHADELVAEPMVVSEVAGDDGRLDVLVVSIRRERVYTVLEPLLLAGLRPISVEPGFLAAGRAYALRGRRRDDRPVVRAVVEVAAEGTNLVVMSGDRGVYAKSLSIGGQTFDEAVAKRLGIDPSQARPLRRDAALKRLDEACARPIQDALRRPAEDLANEVAMSLRYVVVAARIGAIDQVNICGPEAASPGLHDAITAACSGTEVRGEASTDAWLGRLCGAGGGVPEEWAVALGLAAYPMPGRGQRLAA